MSLLAVELLLFELRPRSLIPVALAAAAATAVRIGFTGTAAAFAMPNIAQPGESALAAYIVLGALVGIVAVGVTRIVYEAYAEQVRGLAEGGVGLEILVLDEAPEHRHAAREQHHATEREHQLGAKRQRRCDGAHGHAVALRQREQCYVAAAVAPLCHHAALAVFVVSAVEDEHAWKNLRTSRKDGS